MKVRVSNVRAVKHAEAEGRIIMVCADNQQGKTSLLNAIGAALIGKRDIYGATATKARSLITDGESSASVHIEFPSGGALGITWPGKAVVELPHPTSSEVTAGFVDPLEAMAKKDWMTFVRQIAGGRAKLNSKVLKSKLGELPGSSDPLIIETMSGIKQSGMDAECALASKRALEAKRAWNKITGETFGKSKADGWAHRDHQAGDSLEHLNEKRSELERQVTRRQATADIVGKNLEDTRMSPN